ncbi:MAG: PAS domain S-box protein [Syntrophobacteraceae bacterium]|nr:PAS domain S-box protein [Syntrophobacteraceae bacterium]
MKLAFFGSLRVRLVLLVALAIMPCMVLVTWMGLGEYRNAKARVEDEAMRLVRIAVAQQDHMFRGARLLLEILAHSREARSGDISALTATMAQNTRRCHVFNLGIAAPDGKLLGSVVKPGGRVSFADLACFQQAHRGRDLAASNCVTSRISGKPVIILFYPVPDDAGRVRLMLFATLRLNWLNEFALRARLPAGASLTVWDSNSTVLARQPDPAKWVGKTFQDSDRFKSLLGRTEGVTTLTGLDGDRRIYAFARLDEVPGGSIFLSIGIPARIPKAGLKRLFSYICLLTSLAVVAFLGAWMFGEAFILRHLERIVGCAKRIAAGDPGARVGVPRPMGELGELVYAFDRMGEALEQRGKERMEAEEALAKSEKLYRAVFETTGTAMLLAEEDTTISLVNEQFERLLGFSAEQVEGKRSWADFVSSEDVGTMQEYHRRRRVDPHGAPRQYEARFVTRDGNIRNLLVTVDLIPGTGTSVASLIDITARKKDLETLEKTREELRALSAKNLTLQESEREKLALELHDRVGQNLTGLGIDLAIIRGLAGPDCLKKIESPLQDSKGLVNDTMQCLRGVISELHPPGLSDYGLSAALVLCCEKLAARAGVKILTDCRELPVRTSKDVEIALFRIAQEALCNSINHSRAGLVRLSVQTSGAKIVIRVADDGIGFDPDSGIDFGKTDRFGLAGMRERAAVIGARFCVESAPGEGTVVTVEFEV